MQADIRERMGFRRPWTRVFARDDDPENEGRQPISTAIAGHSNKAAQMGSDSLSFRLDQSAGWIE